MAESNTPPWERMLGNAPPVDDAPAQPTTTRKMPWEMMLGNEAVQEDVQTPSTPMAPSQPMDFDNVFEKLIQAESKGRHRSGGKLTTSPVGAQGITQVMPKTGADPGFGVQPLQNDSEEEYLRFGRDYLQAMLNEFGGDYRKAVAAYNAGAGSVKKAITKGGENWTQYLPKKSETIPYMNKILGEEVVSQMPSGISLQDKERASADKRAQREKLPTFTMNEIVKQGFNTPEGVNAWLDKTHDEYEEAKRGKSRAELDKYYSSASWYRKGEYPKEYTMFSYMNNPDNTITDEELGIHGDVPISIEPDQLSEAFVYRDNPDRIFATPWSDANTRLHESEHLQQNAAFTDREKFPGAHLLPGPIFMNGTPMKKFRQFAEDNADSPAVREVFPSGNAFNNMGEFLANYSAYTQEHGSFKESDLYNTMVKDIGKKETDAMVEQLEKYVLPDTPKFFEGKHIPTNLKRRVEEDKGYAVQLYEYLKGIVGEDNAS